MVLFSQVPSISQDSLNIILRNGSPYDFILIDVRAESELRSMIGNSACKPYHMEWPAQLEKEIGRIGKDQKIFIYCQPGARAGQAVSYVKTLGYTNVFSAGGISSWSGPVLLKAEMLALSDLPKPSMKGTASGVIPHLVSSLSKRKQSVHNFICHDCFALLIDNDHFYYKLNGYRQKPELHRCRTRDINRR